MVNNEKETEDWLSTDKKMVVKGIENEWLSTEMKKKWLLKRKKMNGC